MGKIIKLDQHTTNLIAAGEVIESAVSVVKELVENSIDAYASQINILLQDSGLSEIIVQDNGIGMDPVDAKLSVEPHATSKIKSSNDLYHISTLGFRGEALATIVSVSNFRMKTSTDGKRGFMYSLKGGEVIAEATIAYPKGTEISVKNLFFNTPARLQHLQSPIVELSYIIEYVNKIALARPDIAFKLTNNDKVLLQTYGTNNLKEVVFNIYGDEVTKNMVEFFGKNAYFEISGLISKPSISRSNKNHMTIIVNGRVIRSAKITTAIMEAYKERLVVNRYPICVVNIITDPGIIDVNIHPSKLEIKISNEYELLQMLTQQIDYALTNVDLLVEVGKKETKTEETFIVEDDYEDFFHELDESILDDDYFKDEEEVDSFIDESKEIFKDANNDEIKILTKEDILPKIEKKEEYIQEEYDLRVEHHKDERINKLPPMYYIGQLHGTYLLFQDENNFYIVDQHAAYERINYEKIKEALNNEETIHYELLIPIKLNFPSSEAILVREKIEDLSKIGVIIEDFGSGTFMVREVPIWFTRGMEKEFVEEIIFMFINNKKVTKAQFFDELAATLACKRSIKANQYLDKIHIEYLMEDLGKCEKPYSCPHGRPTIIKFSENEIQRWFKRIV